MSAAFDTETKWYDLDTDMKEYSKKYPNLVFEVHLKGEEGEEQKNYFKNGKMQEVAAKVTFEPFDENKLK